MFHTCLAVEWTRGNSEVLGLAKQTRRHGFVQSMKELPKKSLLYIVQDRDILWKISKRFNVSVEEIRKVNVLKGDALKPGTLLKVPDAGH